MIAEPARLFDFRPYAGHSAHYRQILKGFSGTKPFRSAVIGELVLDDDFYRRPLRPEDLDFLTFTRPVQLSTVSRLASLASQRTLSSLYELSAALAPATRGEGRLSGLAAFANEPNRLCAAQLLPFLEAYAFNYLGDVAADGAASLEALYDSEYRFWMQLFDTLQVSDYLQEGLRFILIQYWCLRPSKRRVLAETGARGHFVGWPSGSPPSLESDLLGENALAQLARMLDVTRQQHSYWQFYLSTSLSKCNLLYALARRAEHCFALYGALYGAQAEWLAFEAALVSSCPHLVPASQRVARNPQSLLSQLLGQFECGLRYLREAHGESAVLQLGQGLAAAQTLCERGRWDLGEQIAWLSSIDQYCEYARTISRRIEKECPDIDRDTFVEPRDMCSTTHVHNDHRLVTIETGVMHFWGNLGMRLEMQPGDRVLIPAGRLHGSTVLSPECIYHQPIIPDEWIRDLLAARVAPDSGTSQLDLGKSGCAVADARESV
jgi:hypothetical protein